MKAILVIDVPTDNLENVIASVNICEQREGYNVILKRMGKMSLKPMPETLGDIERCDNFSRGFICGWNACKEEITGETE